MAARALQLWQEHQARWNRNLLQQTGVLWIITTTSHEYERGSLDVMREAGTPYEELTQPEIRKRWPQINSEDALWGIYEPDGGFLRARLACQAVVEAFVAQGGEYCQAAVLASDLENGVRGGLQLSDGSSLLADQYVLACGPWLGRLFPRTIGPRIRATRQEVFFFGSPAGDSRFSAGDLPVWADHSRRFIYGIPANHGHGFKVADDTRGPEFDPTSGERNVSEEGLQIIRDYVGFRFPGLKGAPLLETRVCQYENSPDDHFILDRHPSAENVFIVGGGSGHGFKHGPVVGEIVAEMVMEEEEASPIFRLSRFAE